MNRVKQSGAWRSCMRSCGVFCSHILDVCVVGWCFLWIRAGSFWKHQTNPTQLLHHRLAGSPSTSAPIRVCVCVCVCVCVLASVQSIYLFYVYQTVILVCVRVNVLTSNNINFFIMTDNFVPSCVRSELKAKSSWIIFNNSSTGSEEIAL